MNCLECRHRILADPGALGPELSAHVGRCSGCSDFLRKARGLDAHLAEAISISAPAALAADILDTTLSAPRRGRRRLALAALFAAPAAVSSLPIEQDGPLALDGIDFVITEEANAILSRPVADQTDLVGALADLGVQLPAQLGHIHDLGICRFGATAAHHLIVSTPLGKITLLLMPALKVERPQRAAAHGLCAVVRRAGSGAVAVIGDSHRSVERACKMVWA